MRTASCCVCGQIEGRADNDLIARLLPGRPYVRRVLLDSAGFAAIPSLGPLVPGHSLLCPRDHVTSLATLDPARHGEFEQVRDELGGRLRRLYRVEIHMFEHGMGGPDARVLCTVEHAHLHLLPLPVGLDPGLDEGWCRFDGSLSTLNRLAGGGEYLYYRTPDGRSRMLAARERPVPSQYLRRLVAAKVGRAEAWDWRSAPDAESADRAWRRFVAA